MTFSTLGTDTTTLQRVLIPKTARPQGLYIIGATGTGKSGLLENLIIQDIEQDLGVCLLDPHGDLTLAVLSRLPDRRKDDVILLDLLDTEYPFGLNLYQCDDITDDKTFSNTRSQVLHVFSRLWGDRQNNFELGVWVSRYLRNSATALIKKGYTMAELPLLFTNKTARLALTAGLTDYQDSSFWEEFNNLKPDEQHQRYETNLSRADAFLSDRIMYNIVGQEKSTIDLLQIINERKILLVKLDRRHEEMTSLIGSVIIAFILNAMYSPLNKRKQFHLYADEFQLFATKDFATLLAEARKFGIGTTIAHQFRDQLGSDNKGATLTAANLIVFRVSSQDADELAGQFDITPQAAWEEEIEKEWVEVLKEEWHERVEEVVADGVEEIKTPVPDLVYRIVPDAPSMSGKTFVQKKYHSDHRVNQFVESLIEKVQHSGSVLRKEDYSTSSNKLPFSRINIREKIIFVDHLNTLFYEVMKEQNPHKELSLDMFEIMMRAIAPAFFDRDRFEDWAMETNSSPPIYDKSGRKIEISDSYLKKAIRGRGLCFDMAPRDYCSSLFIDAVGVYRWRMEKKPEGLEEEDRVKWILAREEPKVSEDLVQAYRLLWLAQDEKQLTVAFRRYEQVLRKVLTEQLRNELLCNLRYHSFMFFDPFHVGGALQFPIPADKFYDHNDISRVGGIVKQQILAWINKNGKNFVWQYKSTGGYSQKWYWGLTEGQEKQFIERLVAELDLEPEINRIIATSKPSFEAYVKEVREVLQTLAKEPMTSGTGINQTRKRTQLTYLTHPRETITHPRKTILHPQRTFQDVKNEIANQLVGLPDYSARVKLKGDTEHTNQTIKPTPGLYGSVLQKRIEYIQNLNRKDGYTRPKQEVEVEIRMRQDALRQAQQPLVQKVPQPLQRRFLVCSNCSLQNRPGANFCNQCGEKL
jgi:hypothetical protein